MWIVSVFAMENFPVCTSDFVKCQSSITKTWGVAESYRLRSTKDFNCVCSNLLISIKTLNVKTKNIFVVLCLKILFSTAIFPSLLKRQSLV